VVLALRNSSILQPRISKGTFKGTYVATRYLSAFGWLMQATQRCRTAQRRTCLFWLGSCPDPL